MAAKAQGCKLFWSTDSGTSYTQVTKVTQVVTPSTQKGRIECSDLDSTAKEYVAGLNDNQAATYPVNFDGTDTSHIAMLVLESSGDVVKWKVEFVETGLSTVTTVVYDGYVDTFDIEGGVDALQTGSLVIQPSAGKTTAHTVTAES